MKTNNFVLAILAAAGVALTASSARAQSYTQGDLLLGFRDTSSAQNYIVDLGAASSFTGLADGTVDTLSLGNIDADLINIFGNGWATDPNLYWGVAGSLPNATLYVGQAESGGLTTPYNEGLPTAQGAPRNNINSVGTSASSFATSSTNANDAFIESTSQQNSWSSWMPFGASSQGSDTAFRYFGPQFEGNSSLGITQTQLDLDTLAPVGTSPGTYDGSFGISSSGQVTFSVIPEPSTYATVALGAAVLLMVSSRRRRTAQA